ncbi:hypothetical protein GLYMA_08G345150v4 [Glycine max]|nr:hypothetical protein GLYMA_08G345150v4 [Glycine max]KAH1054507.1 hypothetical protein GYH30_023336 [Glycine max]
MPKVAFLVCLAGIKLPFCGNYCYHPLNIEAAIEKTLQLKKKRVKYTSTNKKTLSQ